MTYYPGTTPTFTTKTNKVDLVDASHINDLQNEVVAIATELGTNPSETRTTLKARLNSMMDADGSIVSSNAFPDGVNQPSYPSQAFYRSDTDVFYIRNAANTSWTQFGGTLSNNLFCYSGGVLTGSFEVAGASSLWASSTGGYSYLKSNSAGAAGVFATIWQTKFKKIAGISTIELYANIWAHNNAAGLSARFKLAVGSVVSATMASAVNGSNPTWFNNSMDVSGLVNGTVYDVIAMLCESSANAFPAYCGEIIGFGA